MTAPPPADADEIRKTTCYMCACRCGIDVHLRSGQVRYIEGNRDHPVNRGVICAKGAAGIMQVTAPARLRAPLKRVGPRGSGAFEEISWEEALQIATGWLAKIRAEAPEKLAFFTGRDQSQSFTGWWAQAFGTPNFAAHGGFCSVNVAAAGIMSIGGAFWEFGEPDWDRAKILVLFGVAEDHDSNPIKRGLGALKARGARVVSVNPIRTGYNAVADDWLGITPGTDGLLILALVHELLVAGRIDLDYLARFTDAPCLLIAGQGPESGLYLRDDTGRALVIDRRSGALAPFDGEGVEPDLGGRHPGHRTVFETLAERYLDPRHSAQAVAERVGIPAARIRALAAELARVAFDAAITLDQPWTDFRGHRHDRMIGRPVGFHAMRGIAAHSNGFQTARALHLLQMLLGAIETPGGLRFKPPYPKPLAAHPVPQFKAEPGQPLPGPHLGFPRSPADLALLPDGRPARIDAAFTWENPFSAHGLMQRVIGNAHAGQPYRIDTLFLYMANMAWNSSMNPEEVARWLTDRDETGAYVIPHIILSDAYASETVAYADLVLPDTTYLERHDAISLLDRPIGRGDRLADSIRWPLTEPDRDVRPFQSVLCDLGARLGLPGFVGPEGQPAFKDYADYLIHHQRRPGIGPLAGWRGDGAAHGRGAPNPAQLDRYIENGGVFQMQIPAEAQFFKPWNRAWQDWAVSLGLQDKPQPYLFSLWCEPLRRFQLAAEGHGVHQPPEHLRARLRAAMDPLPDWTAPQNTATEAGYPLHALTQRPPAMYHSWGSMNAWLRQILGHNVLYIPKSVWRAQGFRAGDWARVTSPHGAIEVPVAPMAALNPQTVWTWNAIGKRQGAWGLSKTAPEAEKGFLLNHLMHDLMPPDATGARAWNADPVTGQAAWFDLRVRIERIGPRRFALPQFPALALKILRRRPA
ncbi:molybdopterin-dependent oxidoreductase [Rhodobacter capsulatus]|uniref:Dimethyl sulfoxide reductase, A subunit n=1 Tax=Rhodobacter capsulatus (strain ATCC BAA-309 / NBRC 16581 / SB1003) TaxID=272942 RepID=D5AL21_RHOCB|nr:molybdopterin-dependent oxidoreductase [Rhodobacter capsulatus]ADE86011.1 dimethyl sulfoxide reductase, A subunit [Rhodobacter capsulatus SB 1003]ETD01108.1 formate dehydrogenase [Rhodobacter capsulatus DE442]ETD75693.1 formate dehydrogenase [Rhodobacter capsulatus R121]ETE53325.1 formate dehydrogenase [Rhodobacter capsulatus Y262]MDS0926873.1 molybdopterin-dependent oxidoreductase [Rhodobacter capsulatus]